MSESKHDTHKDHGHDHHDHHDHIHDPPKHFLTKYVFSTDHKVIGIQFTVSALLFVLVGGLLALGVRYQIAWPSQNAPFSFALPGGAYKHDGSQTVGTRMTNTVPEGNLAHWRLGGEITLSQQLEYLDGEWKTKAEADAWVNLGDIPQGALTDDQRTELTEKRKSLRQEAKRLPAGTEGGFTGFTDGRIAITLPIGTRVRTGSGTLLTLESEREALINAADVMGDYATGAQQLRAVAGTPVLVELPQKDARWSSPDDLKVTLLDGRKPDAEGYVAVRLPMGATVINAAGTSVKIDVKGPRLVRVALEDLPAESDEDTATGEGEATDNDAVTLSSGTPLLVAQPPVETEWTLDGSVIVVTTRGTDSMADGGSHLTLPIRRDATKVNVDLVNVTELPGEWASHIKAVGNLHLDLDFRKGDGSLDEDKLDAALADESQKDKPFEIRHNPAIISIESFTVPVPGSFERDENGEFKLTDDGEMIPVEESWTRIVLNEKEVDTLQGINAAGVNQDKQIITSDAYLTLFTMHASVMIFLVIIPMLVGGFGNFLIPLMIGARDMAFPKLNMLAFWITVPAVICFLISFWVDGGAAGGGWTMYPPLSELGEGKAIGVGTTLWVLGVAIIGFSSVVGALNYITTVINMRAPGMTMFRMPLTVWALLITSMLALFSTPMLTAAMVMLMFDRVLGTTFFVAEAGGQPLLWQHLFWFYSHPAVYIMILPAMGVTSDILATFARKPIFGYKPMVFAMGAITGLGFIVWGHHMFQSGMNPVLGTTFMASTIMIAVPSAIKTFNWLGTLWGGNIRYTPAMLNAIAFVSMFVIGGLSGIFMAAAPVDIYIHDTYFIVAHIHYVLFGGSLFGIFAGIYYWYPKMFGRQLDQKLGHLHFWMNIIAFNCTFFTMHILGIGGHPRRYAAMLEYPTLEHLQPLNVFMTVSAMALGMAQLPFLWNFFASLPRKLGRALVAVFIVLLTIPAVMGNVYYGNVKIPFDTNSLSYLRPENNVFQSEFYVRGLDDLGAQLDDKAKEFLAGEGATAESVDAYLKSLTTSTSGELKSKLTTAIEATDATEAATVAEATEALKGWSYASKQPRYLLTMWIVMVLFAAAWAAIVTGAVFLVWEVGRLLRLKALGSRALWVIALPAFLSPVFIMKDPYMWAATVPGLNWIVSPSLHQYGWVLIALTALPGIAYLVIVRPADTAGEKAPVNPWEANSLEWAVESPPVYYNFKTIPTVYRGPYEYSSPVVDDDYLPQEKQLPPGVVEPQAH